MFTISSQRSLYIIEFLLRGFYFSIKAVMIYMMVEKGYYDFSGAGKILALLSSLYFIGPMLGGYLTDRFLTPVNAVFLGIFFDFLSAVVLQIHKIEAFYASLSFLVIASALTKSNIPCLLRELMGTRIRKSHFSLLYASTNISAFMVPNLLGYLGESFGWNLAFRVSIFLSILPLGFLVRGIFGRGVKMPDLRVVFCLLFSATSIYFLFLFWSKISFLQTGYLAFLGALILFMSWGSGLKPQHFFILGLTAFYFCFSEMVFFDLNKDIYKNMNRDFFGFTIPATWFLSSRAFFIFLIGVLFTGKGREEHHAKPGESIPVRFVFCFLLIGVGYILYQVAVSFNQQSPILSLFLLLAGFAVNAVSEVICIPSVIHYITQTSPEKTKSRSMGILYGIVSFGVMCSPHVNNLLLGHEIPVLGGQKYLMVSFVLFIAASVVSMYLFIKRQHFMKMEQGNERK